MDGNSEGAERGDGRMKEDSTKCITTFLHGKSAGPARKVAQVKHMTTASNVANRVIIPRAAAWPEN